MRNRNWIWAVAAAWTAGLAALLCDHFQAVRPLIIGTHTLFGIAACGTISLVLFARTRALAGTSPLELYLFTRVVSRWVYILMYSLAIIRVCLYFYEASHLCSGCGPRHVSQPVRPLNDFQFYIVCCVLPLWVARALVLERGRSA